MTKLASKLTIQEDAKADNDTTVKIKTYEELEKLSRKEVLKTFEDWLTRVKMRDRSDLLNMYFNTIASAYDPHSSYMAPKDKKNFDIQMTGQLEGIGATLTQPNAYIKIVKIVPGSPCYKQGELEVNDLILKVAQGDKEPVNVVDMKMDDAIQMIRGKKGTEVRLTVKKMDGTIKVIPIIRDVIVLEETFAKSAIIKKGGKNKKVGYINLPRFYANFSDRNGRTCAVDVEKEVKKLNKENIDKLIIDLRNNGGGSLQDVVKIVGLFIKKGPVVQVKSRIGSPYVLKDENANILYDGQLIIMINEFSASASEILAAAIQDYGRGIIVGSKHTFGKGTVQRFVSIDQIIRGYEELKPFGNLKLTIQKFYRINGGATQLKGVSSDIVLPDGYSQMDIGEKELDYPLEWDEILPASYTKTNSISNLKEIEINSQKRVKSDTSFMLINKYAGWLKATRDEEIETLNLEKYRAKEKERKNKTKRFSNMSKIKYNLQFSVLKADSVKIYSDTIKQNRMESWHKELEKDIYINEVFNIAQEMN